ncbi:MAG: aldose 1-epimerase family protein [Pirellulales bacterium]
MAAKNWTLTDVAQDLHVDSLHVGPADVGGAAQAFSVRKRTLAGGLRTGVNVIEVDNGALKFTILPDRGMGLWRASLGDLQLGWRSPVQGPVSPQYVNLWEPGGIGWLSGFDELLCRCGLESNGAPDYGEGGKLKYPLHGKIGNLPAHNVSLAIDGASGEIAVTGIVDEARMYHNKLRLTSTVSTKLGQPFVTIVDEVTNLSQETGELQLLYHVNFGQPLLDPGSRVILPAKSVVPRDARAVEGLAKWDVYGNEEPGYTEQVYFFELQSGDDGRTQTLLRNAHGTQGVSLKFSKKQLPCFTLWKSTQAASDGYVTGLEPSINFPNPRSYEGEQGRVVKLKPGQALKFELTIEGHPTAESVATAEKAVAAIAGGTTAKVYDKPMPGWSPKAEAKKV